MRCATRSWVVTPGATPPRHESARAAHATALERLEAVVATLEGPLTHTVPWRRTRASSWPRPSSNTGTAGLHSPWSSGRRTTSGLATSSRWCSASAISGPFGLEPFALYRALRRINPAPFLCYPRLRRLPDLLFVSPEILVRVREGEVTIRPIAGTRRRGETAEADRGAGRAELLADPKERSAST